MNPKTTIFLAIALLLAVVSVWWAQPSAQESTDTIEDAGPKSLLKLTLDDVKAFEIKQGDSPAMIFVKDDNKWRMTAPFAAPAETFAVNGDVGRIVALQFNRSYDERDPGRPGAGDTSLDKPLKVVKLTDQGGKSIVLNVGEREKLSRRTYVQIEGDRTIYLVNSDLNADMRRKLSDYRGKRIADFKMSDAVRLQVSGAENFTLVKSDSGWTVEEPFKARAELTLVNKILSSLANVNVLEFVDDDPQTLRPYGLESPRLTVSATIETKTPKPAPEVEGPTPPAEPEFDVTTSVLTLALGGAAEERVFARVLEPAAPTVFQVNESLMKDLGPPVSDLRDKKIAGLPVERASQVRLATADESMTLIRNGPIWQIASGDDDTERETAEFAAVDDLLKGLRDLKALGFEEDTSKDFGFDRPQASIEVSVEGHAVPLRLIVGGETPSKTGVYVRNESDNSVAVVPASAVEPLKARPVSFRTRDILMVDSSYITRIEIVRGGEARVVEKAELDWRMLSPVEGKAEFPAVESILADLSALRGRRVVASADQAAEYGLGDAAMRVTITVTPPAPPAAEDATPVVPSPQIHVLRIVRHGGLVYGMKEGAAIICEIDAKVLNDLEAELLNTDVLAVDPSLVRSIRYDGHQEFAFEWKDDAWKLVGEATFPTDRAKITALLDTLRDLRATKYIRYSGASPADFGLDQPAITITATDEAAREHKLMISGRIAAEGGRYASSGEHPDRVFLIKPDDFTQLSRGVTDFQTTP